MRKGGQNVPHTEISLKYRAMVGSFVAVCIGLLVSLVVAAVLHCSLERQT